MANKLFKLTMLSTLLFTVLGISLTSSTFKTLSIPTKTAVGYASEETDINDHTHDGWVSLSQSDFDSEGEYVSGSLVGGTTEDETIYYYLDDDVTLVNNGITISDYVTLCLNGNTLTGTGSSRVVTVSSGYCKLYDCSGENKGIITGGEGGVYVFGGATLDLYGGSISENNYVYYGGGVDVYNATFNMYGGIITSNSATWGGGVDVSTNATFNMYGGIITSNTVSSYGYGGGVYVNNSTFNMSGGSIESNVSEYYGGGIHLYNGTEFVMSGGTISNNNATNYGGGLDVESSTFNMYGGTISDNTSSSCNGVYVYASGLFVMYGGYLKNDINNNGGEFSVSGGYFTNNPSSSYTISDYYRVVDISSFGSDFDDNYVEGYDYAIYRKYTVSDKISDVEMTYGETFTPSLTAEYTGIGYTWSDGTNTITGFPIDVGDYLVTPHFLNNTTSDVKTTNYYAIGEGFNVSITKGQAEITINSNSKEYDGDIASIDYTVNVGYFDITDTSVVTWYDEEGEKISEPTEVGTYVALIVVDDTDNYYGKSMLVNYSITEKISSDDVDDDENNDSDSGSTGDIDTDDGDSNNNDTGDLDDDDGNTGNSNDDGTEDPSNEGTALSAGAIAGIAIGSILGVGLIAFGVYYFFFKNNTQKVTNK